MSIVEPSEIRPTGKPTTRTARTARAASPQDRRRSLTEQLREARRTATLLSAELELMTRAQEKLESRLLPQEARLKQARAALTASRNRRKEMARVITNRDARILALNARLQTRDQEISTLRLKLEQLRAQLNARHPLRRLRSALRLSIRNDTGSKRDSDT